ncbi:hypothetical protein [Beijerinckia sp. L45]|uniref:hypothetical protein n=1 Tax=Beijerinckia sp. L45 TaxID=1641855 RepID=UPI00131B902C|nr:hypothetical protein [Beijerinckia sp. L45]
MKPATSIETDARRSALAPGVLRDTATYLAAGGDSRLDLDAATDLNKYGCSVVPRGSAANFGSSTASSISPRAFQRVERALASWHSATASQGQAAALDRHVDAMRDELADLLGLSQVDVDIILSPSGTDAQLHALALFHAATAVPVATIVVGADETGSGAVFTAAGRHFDVVTATGKRVQKGARIDGMTRVAPTTHIPANGPDGPRSTDEIDRDLVAAIKEADRNGYKILLQAMNASKLGRRYPSDSCLAEIRVRWSGTVQIVIDACQMRLSRRRLRHHLQCGDMVIVTGSKFFTGPAFSGALLAPSSFCDRLSGPGDIPSGMADYMLRYQWPVRRRHIRTAFAETGCPGAWLRWEGALAEMRSYYSVPHHFRTHALQRFSSAVGKLYGDGCRPTTFDGDPAADVMDEEFAVRTLFPFVLHEKGTPVSPQRASLLHRQLNNDTRLSPMTAEIRNPAYRMYSIGQPVLLERDGQATAALRVSADARYVTDCWASSFDVSSKRIEAHLLDLKSMFAKMEALQAKDTT